MAFFVPNNLLPKLVIFSLALQHAQNPKAVRTLSPNVTADAQMIIATKTTEKNNFLPVDLYHTLCLQGKKIMFANWKGGIRSEARSFTAPLNQGQQLSPD